MVAICTVEYAEAQLREATKARRSLQESAVRVFGPAKGREMIEQLRKQATVRILQDNPHLFDSLPR